MDGSTHEEKRQIFERHFLLGKLSRDEIDTLLHFARVERYPVGREIFAKGSPGQSMMAVLRGIVRISSLSLDGKEIVLRIVHPGEIFGEIAMIDGEERTGIATASEDCELLVLNRRDFMPILERHADICIILLRILCRRLRQTSEQVEDVLFRHLEWRIAKALLQLAETSGRRDPDGLSIDLHLSQRELANLVGGSRESVNKHLQILHRRGLIDLRKGSIVIRDLRGLEDMI
jgi:CRP/FNR family transcriptional regulator, cyclic AMP receptor protein